MKFFSESLKLSQGSLLAARTLRRPPNLLALLLFPVLLFVLLTPAIAAETSAIPPSIGEKFLGERLTYEIGFWLLERVAVSELVLQKEEGGYRALLRAHTTGFVDRVIQHREDEYVAHLKEAPGGGRFITTLFESSSNVNGRVRRSSKEVDIAAGIVKKHSWGGGKDEKREEVRFTPHTYVDDPLGAFYNFRYGVYGPVKVGSKISISTFPKRDYKSEKMNMAFSLEVGDNERESSSQGPLGLKEPAYVARVTMSKDVFGTDLTNIDIFFSNTLIPLRAAARDVAFFTDVRGTLLNVSRERQE